MSILKQSHLGSTVFYAVGPTERMVAIITQVHADDRANLALIKNGIHQAHHPDYAYEVPYGAVCPLGEMTPDTWHSRAVG